MKFWVQIVYLCQGSPKPIWKQVQNKEKKWKNENKLQFRQSPTAVFVHKISGFWHSPFKSPFLHIGFQSAVAFFFYFSSVFGDQPPRPVAGFALPLPVLGFSLTWPFFLTQTLHSSTLDRNSSAEYLNDSRIYTKHVNSIKT